MRSTGNLLITKMTTQLTRDIIQWDVYSWSRALRCWDKHIQSRTKICLELGGRQGGLTLYLALKGKTMICSDLKNTRQTAEPLHRKYDISALVIYEDIDATDIPYENYFDLIIFKSIIGGIGSNDDQARQRKAFQEIHKSLKTGGKLLFAENLSASPVHRWFRKKFVNWGSYWRYLSVNELEEFLSTFSTFELQTTGVLATFGRNERQRNWLARVDQHLLNRICPRNWKYIGYGVAQK
jgi:SAM-dependent methyltransferase